jgi:(S)-ureidoglycine aminohydrolase
MMDPLGSTRSRVCRDHALIAPDSFVTAPLSGWIDTKGVVLISPRTGARFVQYLALMEMAGIAGPPAEGVERLAYVIEGDVRCSIPGTDGQRLGPGGFAYFGPGGTGGLVAHAPSRLCVFEKRHAPLAGVEETPRPFTGNVQEVTGVPFLGDPDAVLQVLLPDHLAFDMAVNLFTYQPGANLPMVEVHVMEHGLLMLDGQGVYRLGDSWYPVQAGDAIWMAPYCPQWFVAIGKTPARYLYYKDVNRDPLESEHRS